MTTTSNLQQYLDSIDTKIANVSRIDTLKHLVYLRAALTIILNEANNVSANYTNSSFIGTSVGSNLKNTPGTVYSIICSNDASSVRYFQLFDKTSAPEIEDSPSVIPLPVFPNEGLTLAGKDVFGTTGLTFTNGISWGFSSTRLTYTPASTTECTALIGWS